MDIRTFWELIDLSRARPEDGGEGNVVSCRAQTERLVEILAQREPREIVAFDWHFVEYRNASYRWDLWTLASDLMGWCSDESFGDFRCWLIAQGRDCFERAVGDPVGARGAFMTMGSAREESFQCESIAHAAAEAYEKAMGQEMPMGDYRRAIPTIRVGMPPKHIR